MVDDDGDTCWCCHLFINGHPADLLITLPTNGIQYQSIRRQLLQRPNVPLRYMDESNFISNAEEIYEAILPTLGTTNGKFICTSTPFNTDSLFWRICNHKDYEDFARHHVTWERALEPNGPLKKSILDKIRKQYRDDPSRWRREYGG